MTPLIINHLGSPPHPPNHRMPLGMPSALFLFLSGISSTRSYYEYRAMSLDGVVERSARVNEADPAPPKLSQHWQAAPGAADIERGLVLTFHKNSWLREVYKQQDQGQPRHEHGGEAG